MYQKGSGFFGRQAHGSQLTFTLTSAWEQEEQECYSGDPCACVLRYLLMNELADKCLDGSITVSLHCLLLDHAQYDSEENDSDVCLDWEPWSKGPAEFCWKGTLHGQEKERPCCLVFVESAGQW
ncbi:PREDICTED: adipogenin isoform X3 [Rhinopithecus bieti]|uniref:adipogenin isoform X3 n=1 Tax=Rhinopithecus bieti TaxID=61621 RepID=UPI00083BAA42|nr:PREDICTED: adipogenin isoform X3 [Rhinopithecus bieti]